ncbi:thiamine pyrophosphate-binding protein [Plantactinospora sp. KLBMP9567]|uniref:thiamine pyrophosphate-binding protein n=1 Tax=Plantactinospora sp. KLBMP9567 TaxID=3085900 RepID=UPI002981B853|nr:thiamine pyrophosphate-binding protein [Plantactinospora sp. KLBMP9567]MDW5324166.1 thiamine pyrophosphate-binding protein [Plantactinospora sp. KLBMP9567]
MTRRTGARVVAEMLDGYGVTHVFLVPAILRRTLAELERHHPHIARVVTHGEKAAAYMADGYARVSGRPGVAAAQVVGALNLAAGLREPFLAGSPVVALTGGRSPATKFRQVYQEIDDLPAFEPVTKFNATIDDADRFPDMLRHAFRVATSGAPGPVHLQIQGNEGQLDTAQTDAEPIVEPGFAQVPPVRPGPDDESVAAVLRLLAAAERPVVVAGGGVRSSRAGAELVALAEALRVPVATSANGKDTIPGTHPLSAGVVGTYSRECANRVVARADLVCFIGTGTGSMTTHFWAVPPIGTPAVQIDLDPTHLGRNYPLRASIAADARAALTRMLALAAQHAQPDRTAWLTEVDRLRADWRTRYREVLTSDAVPIRPERICAELTAGLPGDAVLVVDTGHAGMWMAQFHDTTSAEQSYLRSAGHLGWAFSAGVGAKCAAPDRPVVVFTGDAGLYYHLGEIETAVRRKVNLVTVVNNNHGGNQSRRGFDRAYGGQATERSRELWTYHEVDFARIAEEMGALGIRVDRPGDLATALDRALSAERPVVVDVHTDIDVVAPLPVG